MEGMLDLRGAFGSLPERIYLAAAAHDSADGGAQRQQLPPGDGDGQLEIGEWLVFELPATPDGGPGHRDAGPDGAPAPDSAAPPGGEQGGGGCGGCRVGRARGAFVDGSGLLALALALALLWTRRRCRNRNS